MAKAYGIENNTVEFKSSMVYSNKTSSDNQSKQEYNVFKTVCAFLNTSGGKLYIGVKEDDNGHGVEAMMGDEGIHSDMNALRWKQDRTSDHYARWVQDRIYKYFNEYKDIRNFVDVFPDTDNVVVINVKLYLKKIVRMSDGKVYRRSGGTSSPMNDAQIQRLEKEIKESRIKEDADFRKKEVLRNAIKEEKFVILKKYSSSHSGTIKDRLVEPIDFQDGESVITCYEPDNISHQVGCFKISRIERIELTNRPWENKEKHELPELGLFGWSGSQSIDVWCIVPLPVKNILIENFPSISYNNFSEYNDEFLFNGFTRRIDIPAAFFNRYADMIHYISPELEEEMSRLRFESIGSKELQIKEKLKSAIQRKRQVTLVRYRSNNSQTIKDRYVEPMHFHCNDSMVSCYETDNPQHKIGIFVLSRIEDVIINYNQQWLNVENHIIPEVDMFGWQGEENISFTVLVSLQMKNLLMEQYRGVSEKDFHVQGNRYLFIGESRKIEIPATFFNNYRTQIYDQSRSLVLAMEGLIPTKDGKEIEIKKSLHKAIAEHKKVLIKAYRSNNSQNERDRFVEPISFHCNDSFITCYEAAAIDPKNRTIKISRIGGVEILDQEWEYMSEHKNVTMDVFGWPLEDKKIKFSIDVSLSVKNLLLEQFPGITLENFEKWNNNQYRFTSVSSRIDVPANFFLPHMSLINNPSIELKDTMIQIKKKFRLNSELNFWKRVSFAIKYVFGN